MTKVEPQRGPLRFGNFEADLRTGELRKGGVKLKLGGQPFQVLTILLERPGEVVTREELQKQLWPDTFVDVDHNLNTAINKIREVLGDSAESPRFVETLPRRGYRFLASVEGGVTAPAESMPRPFPKLWWKAGIGIFAILVIVAGAAVVYRWHRQARPQEQANLTPMPFTALAGQAISPAFSPDGSRIAFAWNGAGKGGAKGFDLYVKAIGSETLLQLTHHAADWMSAAWSPDGAQIAFHRMAGADAGIYMVAALGGPERKLHATRLPLHQFAFVPFSVISWSPDGKWIAYADSLPEEPDTIGMYLLSTETLETKQIPPSPKCPRQGVPAFSHDGQSLAYWCVRGENEEALLYSLALPNGEARMIATFRAVQFGLTWSTDDKKLIYSLWNYGSFELGEVPITNGSTNQLAFAGNAALPTVSSSGDKLAFTTPSFRSMILRKDLLHPESPPVEINPSSRAQFDAQYSPDGKHIAFASLRSGLEGVWISNQDGSDLVQISNAAQPSGSPQWSPDGNKIAFDSLLRDRWEIYVADTSGGIPKKLITNISSRIRPHWSRDGQWIYFSSSEVGRAGVYRCPASGGDAVALSTTLDGFNPQESFDRKAVYFAGHQRNSTVKKVLLPGTPGTESDVDGFPLLRYSSLWTLFRGGSYFVPADAPQSVRYFDFATRQTRPVFEADKDFTSGLSISPDGRWILYSVAGEEISDIMLVEHFR